MDEQALWERAAAFHGHVCGGLAIGCKASLYAIELLGLTQLDEAPAGNHTDYVGMLVNVDLNSGKQSCVYMNSKGEIVPVVNPFAAYNYGTEPIVTTLK